MSQKTFNTLLIAILVVLFGFVAFAVINEKDEGGNTIKLEPVNSETVENIQPKTVTESESIEVEVR